MGQRRGAGMGIVDRPFTGWGGGFLDCDNNGEMEIAIANGRFAASDKSGSQTDRGRIYLTWGPPDEIEFHPSGDAAKAYPFQIWRYRNLRGKPNQRDVQLEFAGADYKLVRREGAAR